MQENNRITSIELQSMTQLEIQNVSAKSSHRLLRGHVELHLTECHLSIRRNDETSFSID